MLYGVESGGNKPPRIKGVTQVSQKNKIKIKIKIINNKVNNNGLRRV
jgi:hypothetical protein